MAVPWYRRIMADLSAQKPWFEPTAVHVGFMAGKVTLEQVFLRVFWYSPVSTISMLYYKVFIQLQRYIILPTDCVLKKHKLRDVQPLYSATYSCRAGSLMLWKRIFFNAQPTELTL
jgi:hypothetical protein